MADVKVAVVDEETRPEMADAVEQVLEAQERQRRRIRVIDRATFCATVFFIVFVTYAVASPSGRAFLPWVYCISYPLLFNLRLVQYTRRKWQYFLFDWCYIYNFAIVLYLIFWGDQPLVHAVLFYSGFSIVPLTTIITRNSIVFHSYDRISSCFIHTMPSKYLLLD